MYDWSDDTKVVVPALKELCAHHAAAALALVSGGTVKSLRLEADSLIREPGRLSDDFLAGMRGVLALGTRAMWLLAVVDYLENVRTLDFRGTEVC